MAEISLSAYQERLASHLKAERYDEVIAHARQILKAQPKNLRAYRQLGEALFSSGRWQEAADMLRRALGAQPNHFMAQLLLARTCQQTGEPARAIWHAERALDQQPRNPEANRLLRSLYREHREQEIDRLPLSAGARAQEQVRGNRLADALDTLAQALEHSPERVDLSLARARVLWLDGQRMDAAEAALDILERLPWSIEANRIMTELWLAEQRPSDAQPYLKRVEALDPYLAHQLATGEPAPATLVALDELDDADAEMEAQDNDLNELEDLLPADAIDQLFGEADASQAEAAPGATDSELETSASAAGSSEATASDALAGAIEFAAPLSADEQSAGRAAELDDDLANLLERLDGADEGGDWMAEIQAGSLAGDESEYEPEIADDFEREWVNDGDDEQGAGAPWLSAAMREAMEGQDGGLNPFGEDDGLRNLLDRASDTEPIHLSDIEDWLKETPEPEDDEEQAEAVADMDDDLLRSPPARSWLEEDAAASKQDDANARNAELIDAWQAELDDDDADDDPYVDWLKDDPNDLDGLSPLAAAPSADDAGRPAPDQETARAWGLDSADQLADFVEDEAKAPDWLNAVAPGLDREADASADDPDEFAGPIAAPGRDFAWVGDIVEEETGEMRAIDADEEETAQPYFRFSKPPAWLAGLQARASGGDASPLTGATALSLDADIEALDLDSLTFDDFFNFNTPTDKLDVISLDEDTQRLSFEGLDWDDYFDLESPTEQTIAITLDEDAAVDYDELGIDDMNFDFQKDAKAQPGAAAGFDDLGLGVERRQPKGDADDPNRASGNKAL